MSLYDAINNKGIPSDLIPEKRGLPKIPKNIAMGVVVFGLLGSLFLLNLSFPDVGTPDIAAHFDVESVPPGYKITGTDYSALLLLDIRNPLSTDLYDVEIILTPIDHTALYIPLETRVQHIPIIDKGQNRKLGIPVYVIQGSLAGNYSVEVRANSDQLDYPVIRASLNVSSQ